MRRLLVFVSAFAACTDGGFDTGDTDTGTGDSDPVVGDALADVFVEQDEPFDVTLPAEAFVDPDGDPLVLTVTGSNGDALPEFITDATGGRLVGDAAAAGEYHLVVTASDGDGATVEQPLVFRAGLSLTVATGEEIRVGLRHLGHGDHSQATVTPTGTLQVGASILEGTAPATPGTTVWQIDSGTDTRTWLALHAIACATDSTGFHAGAGTVGSPYEICTAEQWAALIGQAAADSLADPTYLRLMADLFFGLEDTPPVSASIAFDLDGGHRAVYGLNQYGPSASDPVGLFGRVGDLTIRNLEIGDVELESSSCEPSGLVAGWTDAVALEDVHAQGTLISGMGNGTCHHGGLVGRADGQATFVDASARVTLSAGDDAGSHFIGGLIGLAGAGLDLDRCAVDAALDDVERVGGAAADVVGLLDVDDVTVKMAVHDNDGGGLGGGLVARLDGDLDLSRASVRGLLQSEYAAGVVGDLVSDDSVAMSEVVMGLNLTTTTDQAAILLRPSNADYTFVAGPEDVYYLQGGSGANLDVLLTSGVGTYTPVNVVPKTDVELVEIGTYDAFDICEIASCVGTEAWVIAPNVVAVPAAAPTPLP